MHIENCYGPKWPYGIYIAYIGLFGTGKCRLIQVLYLGRAPRTKKTLPDFLKVALGNPTSTCIPRVDG